MKKKIKLGCICFLLIVSLGGCAKKEIPVARSAYVEENMEGCAIKIGIVTQSIGIDDHAINQLAWSGVEHFVQENQIPEQCVSTYVAAQSEENLPYLNQLADEGFHLIVAVGASFSDAVNRVAEHYASTNFLLLEGSSTLPNVKSVEVAYEEGAYLAGVAAALSVSESKKKIVGFIGGEENAISEAYQAGFEQGVAAINPDITVLVDYIGNFYDQATAQQLAVDQYKSGAKVILNGADFAGLSIITEAVARNGKVLFIDSLKDRYEESLLEDGTSIVLTSIIKNIEPIVHDATQAVWDGTFTSESIKLDLSNEGIFLECSSGRNLLDQQIQIIQEFAEKIKSKEIEVSAKLPEIIEETEEDQ